MSELPAIRALTYRLLMIQISVDKLANQANYKKLLMTALALSNKHLMILKMVSTLSACQLAMKTKIIQKEAYFVLVHTNGFSMIPISVNQLFHQ